MSDTEAVAALILWESRQFDTAEIAKLLRVPEPAVSRTIGAARALIADRPETRLGGG